MSDDARRSIERLIHLYGHLIDAKDWERLAQIFTADAVFDGTDAGGTVRNSLAELIESWRPLEHPLSHHATNVLVSPVVDGRAEVVSKGFCLRADGSVFSVAYRDVAVLTPDGWRLSSRSVQLARGGHAPLAAPPAWA